LVLNNSVYLGLASSNVAFINEGGENAHFLILENGAVSKEVYTHGIHYWGVVVILIWIVEFLNMSL